ncbi:MAG TPA: NAD/NADP octopine/nopaline dehydrogenase family protein [Candidatus Limiplasma sp.]|nr:NAD/NADP octopine/nopaline dehydrogenase family protein [Candidatus Limiplasma sp.]
MKITIVGTGNGGTTIGADLALKGHQVTLLKTSDKLHNEHFRLLRQTKRTEIEENGSIQTAEFTEVTTDYAQALQGAELVILYVQTNYHKPVIEKLAPYIQDGQCFLLEPGYLSTCYFLQATRKNVTVIEAVSSPIDCRIVAPGKVHVLFRNVMNSFGVYPKAHHEQAIAMLKQLQYPFRLMDNVIEAALHNPNLIVHTIGAIFSIPRIEYTDEPYWMYKEVFTPHVWNIVESLDKEKMDVLERFGCKRVPYVEACKRRNSEDKAADAKDVFFDYADNFSPKGPNEPDSRFITEDVPQGLVMLEALGLALKIPTPTCTGLINCASAALKRDFRKEGRNLQLLGTSHIRRIFEDGKLQVQICAE